MAEATLWSGVMTGMFEVWPDGDGDYVFRLVDVPRDEGADYWDGCLAWLSEAGVFDALTIGDDDGVFESDPEAPGVLDATLIGPDDVIFKLASDVSLDTEKWAHDYFWRQCLDLLVHGLTLHAGPCRCAERQRGRKR